MSEASAGLGRREGNLDPLLGLRGEEDGGARALRLHGVLQLKHGGASVTGGAFREEEARLWTRTFPLRTNNIAAVQRGDCRKQFLRASLPYSDFLPLKETSLLIKTGVSLCGLVLFIYIIMAEKISQEDE